jgi:hypothetical protein
MARRKIKLEQDEYDFPTSNALRDPWTDLGNDSSLRMIGQIMSYIQFHEYLIQNLRHETTYGWRPVWLDVAEGLYKTVILHYASIVELVLFTLTEQCYQTSVKESPIGVVACFKRVDRRYYEFSGKEIQVRLNECSLRTKLYGCHQRELPIDARDVGLDMLIRAGRDMGLYDDNFSDRLSKLNDLRNGIHLRKQALLRKQLAKNHPLQHVYTKAALEDCKSCLEELRRKIVAYRSKREPVGERSR